ncbi:MAG: Flp pilus assembly protein CpaB [Tepidisphaeraceae bacterium]
MKTIISLGVAVTLGLLATWIGRNIVLGNRLPGIAAPEMVSIVVAKRDIETGQVLAAEDLTLVEYPSASVSRNMVRESDKLLGRAVTSPVVRGQAMFESLLAPTGSDGGLIALVPPGMRAVSVDVSESSGVAGLLTPGAHVDVIATLRLEVGEMARTIVEDVKVQAVGRRLVKDKSDDSRTATVKTVTLIVSPKDAEAIELAGGSGRLRLVLRGAQDTARNASPGITFAELTGARAEPGPSTRPSGKDGALDKILAFLSSRDSAAPPQIVRQQVQIIRGGNESTIYYEWRPDQEANSVSVRTSGN